MGLRERRRGNDAEALIHFQKALRLEVTAIDAMSGPRGLTYSILHRSAATLALDCNDLQQAERLAEKALKQSHPAITEELHDVLRLVKFTRYLESVGPRLQTNEILLSLTGEAVEDAGVSPREIARRLTALERLIYRSISRLIGMPYRSRIPEKIRQQYPIFVSASPVFESQTGRLPNGRRNNFSISFRLGSSSYGWYHFVEAEQVVSEIQDLMDIISRPNMTGLRERIPDSDYLRDFLVQAKKLAPDGWQVREVGITSTANGTRRPSILVRPSYEMPLPPTVERIPN